MARTKHRIAFLIDYLNSEYSDFMLQGIKSACKQFDMELAVFTIAALHDIKTAFDFQNVAITALLTHSNIDGIIFPAGTQMRFLSRHDLKDYLRNFGDIPIVSIGCELVGIPSISVDCYESYKELINFLIDEQGCRKFGILGVRSKSLEATKRTEAIYSVLKNRGISADKVTRWTANFDYSTAYAELQNHYDEKGSLDFDAILCLNDEMQFAAQSFCQANGIRIPQDIAVAGFDNIERCSFSKPSMTSIDQSIPEQGYEAVRAMKQILETGIAPEMSVVKTKVYCRESTNRNPSSKRIETPILKFDLDSLQASSKYTATEWYLKKFQLYQITKYYTDMQTDLTTDKLKNRLNEDLQAFGIKGAAVVIYDKSVIQKTPFDVFDMPDKAFLYSAYDNDTGFDSTKNKKVYRFNPKETMVPDNILHYDSDGVLVMAIFHGEIQYGYIVFRPGNYDISIYEMLSKILSSIIYTVFSYTKAKADEKTYKIKYTRLDKDACTDELTGLNNRRGLFSFGQALLDVGKAMDQSGLIIFCDMDGLKKINDTYGHAEGDRAILAESIILKGNFRSNDIVARIGGDEFAMICPGLTISAFEKIKTQVTNDCISWSEDNNSGFDLAISMGYVQYPSKKSGYQITKLLSEADEAQYKEKRSKRKS